MNKKEQRAIKIQYIRKSTMTSLQSHLDMFGIDKKNFAREIVSEEKIDKLVDYIYNQNLSLMMLGALIKSGDFEGVIQNNQDIEIKEEFENER